MRVVLRLLAFSALSLPAVAGDLVVGAGQPFTGIQAAIDAAQAGDRVLVKPGQYTATLVIDKPLELIGAGHTLTKVRAASAAPDAWSTVLRITGLATGERVRVAGLLLETTEGVIATTAPDHFVELVDCAGVIELTGVRIQRGWTQPSPGAADRSVVLVRDCASAVMTSVTLGVFGSFAVGDAGCDGLRVERSHVSIDNHSSFAGGTATQGGAGLLAIDSVVETARSRFFGATSLGGASASSGAGIRAVGSHLRLHGGTFNHILGGAGFGAPGGPGAVLDGASVLVRAADAGVAGGPAEGGQPAAPAAIVVEPGGQVVQLVHRLPSAAVLPAIAVPVLQEIVQLQGHPGALLVVAMSVGTASPLELAGIGGALALDPSSLFLLPVLTLPASGTLEFPVTVPGAPGAHFALQTVQVLGNAIDCSPPTLLAVGI